MSNAQSLTKVTPRQARALIIDALDSGVVPFVRSSPGLGKSAIFKSIADQASLKMNDIRLSTCAPEDLSGLPEFYNDEAGIRRSRFVPFSMFPVQGTPIPMGKKGWLIFLDEMNHAPKEVQAASYKLILDKEVAEEKLHEAVAIGAAGNLDTDRAITNPISTALQSRVAHLEMEYSYKELRDDVMLPNNWDYRIVTWLEQHPSKGMDFRPDHNDKTFACPRTWEFMNKYIKGKDYKTITDENGNTIFEMQPKLPLYAGTIGAGAAIEFLNYCRVFGQLPPYQTILSDPLNALLPDDVNIRWATVGMMTEHIEEDNFVHFATYADRMPMNFRVLFYRIALKKHQWVWGHPEFSNKMSELSRYLNN